MKQLAGGKGKRTQGGKAAKQLLFPTTFSVQRDDAQLPSTLNMASQQSSGNAFNLQQELTQFRMDILSSMKKLETDILEKLNITLQPFTDQLQELQAMVQQNTNKAEMTLDLTESLREENSHLQQEIAELKDRNVILECTQRRTHLKFRSLPDGTETPQELLSKENLWLCSLLEGCAAETQLAMYAYRLGTRILPNRQASRDLVVELRDDVTKFKILELVKPTGCLMYQEERILVFRDLPPAALQIRATLKPVTQVLRDAKLKYRWLPTGKLSVYDKGQQLIANNLESGKNLLYEMNLDIDSDSSRRKRKPDYPTTPRKDSKIPVRNNR